MSDAFDGLEECPVESAAGIEGSQEYGSPIDGWELAAPPAANVPLGLVFPVLPRRLFGYARPRVDAAFARLKSEFQWLEEELSEQRRLVQTLESAAHDLQVREQT